MYTHIDSLERERIGLLKASGMKVPTIARKLGRDPTTLRREIRRSRPFFLGYRPSVAEKNAKKRRAKPRFQKKLSNPKLWKVVKKKLEKRWSPEQIAHFLKETYAEDTMHVSHESIYTYIYVLPRGELRKELISYLRQGARGRQRRKRGTNERRGKIPNMISIHERPKEVSSRTVPGHWESDLLMGKGHASAIGTLVERTTRTTILVSLKTKDAEGVRKAFARTVKRLPKETFLSLTHDRGSEMSEHELFTKDTEVQVYFADPHSPWQRGTNENTNGLIRQFFPKGTDFKDVSVKELKRVQQLLNERPRETLHWQTPQEAFTKLMQKRAVRV